MHWIRGKSGSGGGGRASEPKADESRRALARELNETAAGSRQLRARWTGGMERQALAELAGRARQSGSELEWNEQPGEQRQTETHGDG